ncbi:MAG: hypothetical protein RLZZ117_1217 [Cyanobacteriota bacterium]
MRAVRPPGARKGATSIATSSASDSCSAAGTIRRWPNHSRSRAPSGRERPLKPIWSWSTSRGTQSWRGGSSRDPTHRQAARWGWPLTRRTDPSRRPPWTLGIPGLRKGWTGGASLAGKRSGGWEAGGGGGGCRGPGPGTAESASGQVATRAPRTAMPTVGLRIVPSPPIGYRKVDPVNGE